MSIVSRRVSASADAAMRRQRRIATVSSIVISVLGMVLVLLILALILLPGFLVKSTPIVAYQAGSNDEEEVERPQMTPPVQRKPRLA